MKRKDTAERIEDVAFFLNGPQLRTRSQRRERVTFGECQGRVTGMQCVTDVFRVCLSSSSRMLNSYSRGCHLQFLRLEEEESVGDERLQGEPVCRQCRRSPQHHSIVPISTSSFSTSLPGLWLTFTHIPKYKSLTRTTRDCVPPSNRR